ncbi:WXG100 family type VII secretion target [Nocardia amamiensis]|uniref:WXG100 family type VII secretion target n=1 Tax=Nocardia amamiensis TaxID=404578 RepID=A0ABS0CM03_9NOCA|nr:WXG100 family type VII secretion target [Nocardia amamiensis]MBF6297639.1 WXG100 family type VII secretion target [Nocardia amamiensis]
MSKVSLDDAAAAQVVNDFMTAVGQIKTTIGNIGSDIEAAKPGWQGDANDACGRAAQAWQDEGARLNSKLDDMTSKIFEGSQTKNNVDAENVDSFTNLV